MAARTIGLKDAASIVRCWYSLMTPLRFTPTETILGYRHVLHTITSLAHGVPVALYSDKHSIFRIHAKNADPEGRNTVLACCA